MTLTATAIQNAKVTDKPVRLFDRGGLYLELSCNCRPKNRQISSTAGTSWLVRPRMRGMAQVSPVNEFRIQGFSRCVMHWIFT